MGGGPRKLFEVEKPGAPDALVDGLMELAGLAEKGELKTIALIAETDASERTTDTGRKQRTIIRTVWSRSGDIDKGLALTAILHQSALSRAMSSGS